ncbi:MAG TPA: hypothetical protein ENN00_01035 [Bacillaceae bacterium]|nr:hypothetical protein [Bacillaceae bacterium]
MSGGRGNSPEEIRKRRLRLARFLLAVFLLSLVPQFVRQERLIHARQAECDRLAQAYASLSEERARLLWEKSRLEDPEVAGALARRFFLVARPGEILFDWDPLSPSAPASEAPAPSSRKSSR